MAQKNNDKQQEAIGPVTKKLAEFVAATNVDDMTDVLTHQVKRSVLDFLGVAIAGSTTDVSKTLRSYFISADFNKTCTIIGDHEKLSPYNAAFANGTSAHAHDFDDGHTGSSIHQGGMVFPAMLAAFEQYKPDFKKFVLGSVIGQEVSIRIGLAGHPATWRRGFHNTGIIGPFGAAAAVSKILGLDYTKTINALGLAGSFSSGLFEFLEKGADTKRIHPGKAGRDGLICAELAARGMTGPDTVLEGEMGYFRAYADNNVNVNRMFSEIGSRWEMLYPYHKLYPCCRHLHAPIDVALMIRKETNIRLGDIKEMKILTYTTATRHNAPKVSSLLEAQMSMPCAVALAIKYGKVGFEEFTPQCFSTDDVVQLMKRISVQVDPVSDKNFPNKRITTMIILTNSGQEIKKVIENPKGAEDNPLTDEEMAGKFLSISGPVLGASKSREIAERIWAMNSTEQLLTILNLCSGR